MDDKRLYLMGQEKIGKALRIMAVPAIIGMMVNSVYNIVDALFVGWLGKEQLGATGIAFPIFMLIGAFGISIGMGANSYISRLLGAKDIDQAEKTAGSALLAALVMGVIVTTAGQIWLSPILKLFGATPGILPYATDYTRIIFWSSGITMFNMVFNNILRAEGSATVSMIGMVLGAVLNIALDPLFIFVFDMGIKGAAWGHPDIQFRVLRVSGQLRIHGQRGFTSQALEGQFFRQYLRRDHQDRDSVPVPAAFGEPVHGAFEQRRGCILRRPPWRRWRWWAASSPSGSWGCWA